MSMKPLLNSLLLVAGCALLSACNQYSEGGLVGDYEDTSKCPANGCASQAASANLLKLTTTGNTVSLYPAATDTKVEVSGDCHASTYPNNRINVTVVTQNGNTPVAAPTYSVTGSSVTPACRKGKFGVAIDIRNLAVSSIYTVKLELVAYDSAGAPVTNAGGGYLFLNLVR
ncbi:hypothetical protein [Bdellovibrio sp. HCB337]|uniref:hypothetical protein n=1 Tax=Bdellovibrio sp. HCB337 TaxID=3394358 RepID=UPI0039A4C249